MSPWDNEPPLQPQAPFSFLTPKHTDSHTTSQAEVVLVKTKEIEIPQAGTYSAKRSSSAQVFCDEATTGGVRGTLISGGFITKQLGRA